MSNPFAGSWRLVSFESRTPDGQVGYPMGPSPVGYLLYTAEGYVSLAIMQAGRPKFAAGDLSRGSAEEKAAAAEGFMSYCGPYEIRPGNVIVHHSVVAFFPNWEGTAKERFYEFSGNWLSLSTPPLSVNGEIRSNHLIWERVGAADG